MIKFPKHAISIMLAAVLWAVEGIVLLPYLFNLSPPFIVFAIHAIAFLLLSIFLFSRLRMLADFSKDDWLYFFLIGLFGGAIGTLAIVKALQLVQFQKLSVVLLLQKLQPLFAILLAFMLLKEKPKKSFWLWASVAVLASYTLTFGFSFPNLDTGENTALSALFAILAAASFGSGTVFSRKVAEKFDSITATYFRYAFTTAIMLFYMVFFSSFFVDITKVNAIVLVAIPLTTGIGSLVLYYYGMKKIKASIATICELMFPVSAIALDYFVNGSILSMVQIISAVVMLIAITKVSYEA